MDNSDDAKPLEELTRDEVKQWFLRGEFSDLAPKFYYSGQSLADLSEAQFQKELGNIQGSVLYNAVQRLIPPYLQSVFDSIFPLSDPKSRSINEKKLGRFFKIPLPFSNSLVDARLFDDEVTPAATEILDYLERGEAHCILLGKSGDGKTRAIFDVARKYFTIYMECVPPEDERKDPTRDIAYQAFYKTLKEKSTNDFQKLAREMVDMQITARVLLLFLLLKKYPQLTPQQFLLAQLHGAQVTLVGIVTQLQKKQMTPDHIRDLMFDLSNQLRRLPSVQKIVFAVDEAGLAQTAFHGSFHSLKSHSPRGLLTQIATTLSTLPFSTIYSGTNRSLGFGETLQSDIGKPDCTFLITKFHSTSEEENEDILTQRLNLDGCSLSQIEEFRYLTGRSRLRDSVLVQICKEEFRKSTTESKQEVLETAVKTAIEESRNKLRVRFRDALAKNGSEKEIPVLARLYAATTFFGGKFAELYPVDCDTDEQMVDLVEVGLASIKYIELTTKSQLVVVNEPLSCEVVKEVLGNWDPLKKIREQIFGVLKHYNAKTASEQLVGCVLMSQQSSIADFANKFGIQQKNLPLWAKESNMYFPAIVKLRCLRFQDESEFLDATLDKITNSPFYCSPLVQDVSQNMRPDIFAVCGIGNKCFFTVIISTKLYNSDGFPSKEVTADLYSTDWDRVYHTKPDVNGNTKVNPKALKRREKWDNVLVKYQNMKHVGSLRLHVLLPCIGKNDINAPGLCRVEGNDIIIYIDNSNASLFFDEATRQMLAILTSTDISIWKHQDPSTKNVL